MVHQHMSCVLYSTCEYILPNDSPAYHEIECRVLLIPGAPYGNDQANGANVAIIAVRCRTEGNKWWYEVLSTADNSIECLNYLYLVAGGAIPPGRIHSPQHRGSRMADAISMIIFATRFCTLYHHVQPFTTMYHPIPLFASLHIATLTPCH